MNMYLSVEKMMKRLNLPNISNRATPMYYMYFAKVMLDVTKNDENKFCFLYTCNVAWSL